MKGFLSDCRHALRLYRRTPGASLIAVFVLAIGMAFVGAFLSLYVDLILRPHPGFEQSGELATAGFSGGPRVVGLPPALTERMTEEMSSIEAVASSLPLGVMLGTDREAASAELVSAQFFDGLRPRLALGRGFLTAEQTIDSEPVVVISNRLWQTRFGGDPGILGTVVEVTRDQSQTYYSMQTIQTDRGPGTLAMPSVPERETTSFRIVGVMAQTLRGLAAAETDLWFPQQLAIPLYVGIGESPLLFLTAATYLRRSPGVSATAVLGEIESRYAAEPFVTPLAGTRLDVIDGIVRDFGAHREAQRQLQLFLAGSVLLALVAGANVSLFLLARAPGRRRELGIRLAIGAPMRRVARQLATEAGLLVLASAILGLVASVWLGMYLRGLALLRDAEWRDVTLLDGRVLGFAVAFMLVLTLLVALAPVVGLRRAGIAASSREIAGRASLAQRLAGTAQLAVAGALGAAAVAFAWHLGALMLGDPGYELTDRYVAQFQRPAASPGATPGVRRLEVSQRREIMESIPGVAAVSFGRPVPGVDLSSFAGVNIPRSDSSSTIEAASGYVDGRFVEVLGLRLAHGRALGDDEEAVMVNQALARAVFGREDVVGERLPEGDYLRTFSGQEIVGVLEDMSYGHPAAVVGPFVFGRSGGYSEGPLVIESGLTAAALQQELDRLTESGRLDGVFSDIRPLRQPRADQLAPDRARTSLTIATAALVVLLAAFGYYGTQRYLVAAGRREYAIRASLGAGPRALGKLVVSRGLLMSLPGLVLGGMLAFIAVAWLRSEFLGDEVSPTVVAVAVVAGLALLLLAATLGPAGEARRTQPAPLLRED